MDAYHEIYTKKACKKINRFVYILIDFGIGSLVIIYIGHYFRTVLKYNKKIVERGKINTCNTQIQVTFLAWYRDPKAI
jgi:hypothetical protein